MSLRIPDFSPMYWSASFTRNAATCPFLRFSAFSYRILFFTRGLRFSFGRDATIPLFFRIFCVALRLSPSFSSYKSHFIAIPT